MAAAMRVTYIQYGTLGAARSASYAHHFTVSVVICDLRRRINDGYSWLKGKVVRVELKQGVLAQQVIQAWPVRAILILSWDTYEVDKVGIGNFENFRLDQEHRASVMVTSQNKGKELSLS